VLAARDLAISDLQHSWITAERDASRLTAWLRRAVSCASVEELLADE
jgi:hypothetical protein